MLLISSRTSRWPISKDSRKMSSKVSSLRNKSNKSLRGKKTRRWLEDRRLLPKEKNSKRLTKNLSRFKPRLLLKKKKKRRELKSMLRRETPSSTWREPRSLIDLPLSKLLNKHLLIDKSKNWWRSGISKRRHWINKLQKLRPKPMPLSRRRKEEETRWRLLLKEVERIRSIVRSRNNMLPSRKS